MKYILITILMLTASCASFGGKKKVSIEDVFGHNVNRIEQKHIVSFNIVDVIKDVYPPAKGACVDLINLNETNVQCLKFLNWTDYVVYKHGKDAIIKDMQYNYEDKLMMIFIKTKE